MPRLYFFKKFNSLNREILIKRNFSSGANHCWCDFFLSSSEFGPVFRSSPCGGWGNVSFWCEIEFPNICCAWSNFLLRCWAIYSFWLRSMDSKRLWDFWKLEVLRNSLTMLYRSSHRPRAVDVTVRSIPNGSSDQCLLEFCFSGRKSRAIERGSAILRFSRFHIVPELFQNCSMVWLRSPDCTEKWRKKTGFKHFFSSKIDAVEKTFFMGNSWQWRKKLTLDFFSGVILRFRRRHSTITSIIHSCT